jgi:hypothetical protein
MRRRGGRGGDEYALAGLERKYLNYGWDGSVMRGATSLP